MKTKKNIIKVKTYDFAKAIVRICQYLQREKKEFVLSRQLLRSGTAPGAQVREAEQAESRKDFVHKMSIGLKEANETAYWLNLLKDTDYLSREQFAPLHKECTEIICILVSIVKSSREKEE
jgi:four helix bundle protein